MRDAETERLGAGDVDVCPGPIRATTFPGERVTVRVHPTIISGCGVCWAQERGEVILWMEKH
jgi:hypothetical protein